MFAREGGLNRVARWGVVLVLFCGYDVALVVVFNIAIWVCAVFFKFSRRFQSFGHGNMKKKAKKGVSIFMLEGELLGVCGVC